MKKKKKVKIITCKYAYKIKEGLCYRGAFRTIFNNPIGSQFVAQTQKYGVC